jgi:hypothetical protein
MEAKANLELDGQEITVIIKALTEKASKLLEEGKTFEADLHLMIAIKMKTAKTEFHQKYDAIFSKRYGLTNNKKPAGEQTLHG